MALNMDVIGEKIGPLTKSYKWNDVVLYALGVGAGFDELQYVFENKLKVIPSFSIASVFDFLAEVGIKSNADLSGILHGEQDIIFHSPIPVEGELITTGAVTNVYDKGADKGALVVAQADTFHGDGQKLYTNIFTLFCRKDGGFGGDSGPSESVEFPDRPPDFEEQATPPADQPLLYRLSGDIFALHVDPEFATASGFEKPIMHGLCTHGYACRAVIKHLFEGQPERMTRFRVRFSKTLYPGVPIKTQIWKIDEGKALFRTVNEQDGEVTIDRGVVEWMSQDVWEVRKKQTGIRFDGQVAIVTGAGAGLGRSYALELGRRGAKVVVNDLGGARDGSGDGATKAADKVVTEIVAAGGEAVASHDSVATAAGGEAIVKTATDAFGRVDILINNAGILRDKSMVKMDADSWSAVLDVHMDGAYNVSRPAFIQMRQNGYGRILFTSSAAGLYGNFGQTNYAAAKMAAIGLMNTLRLEGEKYGVKVNTIAPIAATRLTEDILPPEMMAKLSPDHVTPLALYLCAEQCPTTGGIYDAGMGFFDRAAIVTGPGAVVGDGVTPPEPEAVAKAMSKIKSLKGAELHHSAVASLGPMLDAFKPKKDDADQEQGVTVADIFEQMPDAFLADQAGGVDVIFQYEITGDGGGQWYSVIAGGTCEVSGGQHDAPTTTIIMGSEDFLALMGGTLNPMQAYTTGKLKIEGDLMKSQLIEKLFSF